jgi:hypothetical protein
MLNEHFKELIQDRLALPHIFFPQDSLAQKKNMAKYINSLPNELIVLPTSFAFSYCAFIAGISEKQIEYIAKNAPKEYKKELFDAFFKGYKVKEIYEIAKAMDEDLPGDSIMNQQRIKKLIQYLKDNLIAFEF